MQIHIGIYTYPVTTTNILECRSHFYIFFISSTVYRVVMLMPSRYVNVLKMRLWEAVGVLECQHPIVSNPSIPQMKTLQGEMLPAES